MSPEYLKISISLLSNNFIKLRPFIQTPFGLFKNVSVISLFSATQILNSSQNLVKLINIIKFYNIISKLTKNKSKFNYLYIKNFVTLLDENICFHSSEIILNYLNSIIKFVIRCKILQILIYQNSQQTFHDELLKSSQLKKISLL